MADVFNGIRSNNFDEVKAALVEDPSCINSQDEFGRIPAMYALMGGDIPMLKWLSQQDGFDAAILDNEENGLVQYSLGSGDVKVARYAFSLMYPEPKPRPNLTLVP